MIEGLRRWRLGLSKRKTLKPRLRISSRVFHSRRTPPPCRGIAAKEANSTAVGLWMVELDVEELFVRFGSPVVAETFAVLVESAEEPVKVVALTLMVTTTRPPTLIELRVQLTVVVPAV